MNAVGTLRTIFAQGVYTVSGPFHPFGGAVDIIVVEQEDGTFKSSPWYVKFGKFQGVLKRREKRVALAVNDGEEANFHMYLDHKGEAYFLKDVQGDETAPLALTEATSSGDESSHTYAREKREAESRAELGKEESEDDRGDDLELKLEGREASKQLIQEHRDCDALDREKINATQSEPFTEEDGRQENIVPLDSGIETSGGGAGSEHIEHIERKFRHALCGTDGGPRKDGRSKSARDFLSDAACASHTVSTPYHPGFNFTKHGMTHDGENASRNGMLIHCLLNLAVGRQPIDKSGTAVALVAKAALSSLERVVSGPQTLDADNKFSVPQGQQKLARFHDSVSNPAKPPEDVVGESSSGESDIRQDKDLVEDILSKAFTGGPRSYTGNTCNDVKSMIPVSSVANFSGADADKVANVVSQPFPVGPCPENFDASTTLEVKRVEIRDDAVVVQVRERLEVERHGQFPLEEGDVIENIVIDRSQLENEAFGRRDDAEQHGEHVESGGSQKLAPEEYEGDITVEVNKHLVEELKAGLEENENEDREMVLAAHETPTNPRQEGPGTSIEKEDASSSHTPPTGTQDAPAGIQGNSKKRGGVENEPTLGRTTSGKKVALANQVNVPNVSSPRQKAAVDLEMAWRQVMDRAATSLKGAPYASEKLHHSASDKKVNSTISGSHGKEGGSDEVQAERKSWGWLWGGSSAPQPKQGSDQDGTKDGKRKESSAEGELPGVISEKSSETASEVLTKKTKANKSLTESQTNQVEAVGKYTGSGVESGRTEGRKGASNVSHLNGNEHHSESTPNNQAQQQTKRRFFGIFGSGNSPSLASSAQRDDDQHSVRPLKSEDSLEKAENMLDIYEQTWEKGFHANQGFSKAKDPPVKKVLEAKITETVMDLGGEAEISDSHTEDSNIKQGGTIETDVDLRPAEDLTDLPNIHRCRSPSGSGLVTEAATPQAAERDENPALSNQLFNEAQVSPTVSYAETGRESDPQPEIGVDVNWPAERQPNTPTSDTSPNGLKSISNTDVVILSADGRILAAPIVDQEELEALEENHEQEQRQELAVDVGDNYINAGKSPRGAIRFADVPKSVERPFVGPDENRPLSNGVHPESQCEVITSSENVHQLMDIQGGNCTEIVSAGNGAAVPKGLAIIMEFEDTKGSQAKAWGDSDKGVRQESGLTLDTRTCLAISDDGQATSNGVGSTEMQRRTDAFGDPNIADDGDTLDSSKQEMERFFSSRNLFEPDETKRFRRPNYLDAVGVDNDQDTLDTVTEDEPNKSSEKTDPIEIPGAGRRARNFASLDDPQILRTSESLPNARHHTLDPDMASPGLTMSRSLDSAPLSALLTSDRSEVIPSSVLLTTGSEGNVAVGAERHLEHSQAESRPAEDSLESHKQNRATGFELSLCRHLLKEKMGAEAAADAFASEKITLEEFRNTGSVIAANDKLVVRVGDQYYPWVVASPIVLGILAFGQVLVSPDEGAIAVEKPTVTFDGQSPVNPLTTVPSAGWSKLWPFGGGRTPKTPEKENVTDLVSKDELQLVEAALKTTVTKEYLQLANYYLRPRKIRTNSPSSQQLASLNLKEGSNKITFTFVTRVWGKQQVGARIYLWKWNTRIVISDVDGTITKSDVLGQVMPLVGKDWTQSGVARLFSSIKKNGYELMFLSARAISQAHLTRQFLESIKQDGEVLPDGPVVISPDGLFPSLYREVIRRAPHEFKIACLQDIKSLFPSESKPFYAGFGNRDTDELSYLKVGISKGKIFTINPKGEVVVNNRLDVKSYTSLHKLVHDMFPSMTVSQQEDYNEWNFWKLPLPDIEDELLVSSTINSLVRKGVKSGKVS